MQSTSPVWKGLFASGAALQARATIGGTVYTDIGVPVINRATMQDRLAVGNVVSASLALALRSAGSVPRSAAVVIEVRLNDGQTASEWLPQGTFYISRRMRDPVTGLLALECYDALLKANALWTPSAGSWPRTLAVVTAELAALLGVALDSRTVIPTGAAYAMSEPDEGTTIRDALSIVAQAAGGNWIITPAGKLRLVRLGEAGDTVDVAGVVGGIDVGRAGTITGVRSTVDGVATLTGDDTGLVVDVALAPVIAADMAEALIGQAWQPFRLEGAVYDPAAELGDAVRAGANGEVASALCSEQAAYGPAFRGSIAAPDPGEVTDEYPYIGSAERTLALAKAAVDRAVERYDDNLTQQEIFNRLTDNGAAQGLVLYNGQLYINASYIRSGTLVLGGLNNINGTLQVLDASGTLAGTITKDGISVGTSTSSATLNNGILKFVQNGAEVGRIWPGNTGDIGDYMFIYGPESSASSTSNRSAMRFWSNGNVNLQSGDETVQLIFDRDTGDASLVADGTVHMQSSGDVSLYLTNGGNAEIRSDGGAASIILKSDGDINLTSDYEVTIGDTDAKIVKHSDGTVHMQSSGDASVYVTNGGNAEIRSDNGAASIILTPNGDVNVSGDVALDAPLPVTSGGSGARNAAGARANLEITPANIGAKPTQTAVADPTASGTAVAFIAGITQNANGVITPTKKTVRSASQSESGLMSATDKAKLDGIAAGAQVNSLTGVKGNAESSYRTGNVNLTPANIGAAPFVALEQNDTTAALIYAKLSAIPNAEVATVHIVGVAFDALTGKSIGVAVSGTVYRSSSSMFSFDVYRNSGGRRWAFQATITSSAITPGTVYTYSGAVVS